jgi:hypothetical protein
MVTMMVFTFLLINVLIYTKYLFIMNSSSQMHTHLEAPSMPTPSYGGDAAQNKLPMKTSFPARGPFVRKPLHTGGFLMKTSYGGRMVTK